ncbi:hypothetical protein DMH17_01230 [Raoultella planticola]|nr:hypothetical protein [Raoultella planticola]
MSIINEAEARDTL